jgi:hypothetical protein
MQALPAGRFSLVTAHYANAKQIERGTCWRMVSRDDGYRTGSPTGCPKPVRWTGNAMIGKKRYRLDSCEGHADEVENVRPIRCSPGRITE